MTREQIERYRAQNFRRKVTERTPVDLDYDEVTLSCGHKRRTHIDLIEASSNRKRADAVVWRPKCRSAAFARKPFYQRQIVTNLDKVVAACLPYLRPVMS